MPVQGTEQPGMRSRNIPAEKGDSSMKVLFQGDSITDAGRDRADPDSLGGGYVSYTVQELRARFPGRDFTFINRGVSGDRTMDMLARWQEDCIAIQPDVVSILIGVNDTLHGLGTNEHLMTAEETEENYRRVLEETRDHTRAKILIMEPYFLHVRPEIDDWRESLNAKIMVTRRLAREFADAYVPLDGLFAAASVQHEPAYWAGDGVHPSIYGVQLIARHCAEALAALL